MNREAESRAFLVRRGLFLEYATLGWNVFGSVVVLAAAYGAGSVALAGFGVDSLIEIFASVVVIWQLTGVDAGREKAAMRCIGLAFFGLALYIVLQSAYILVSGARPGTSTVGIVWLAATVLAMLALALGKRTTGNRLANPVLVREGHVTLIDALLAAAVLAGLLLNALTGLWWVDPLAGLVIVYYGIKEGREALRDSR